MSHHPSSASGTPIDAALHKARGILPDQGPLGVFIHHNTLHAFQHLRFAEAVEAASQLNGARPYLDLEEYQAAWHRGRIDAADVDEVLRRSLTGEDAAPSALGLTRHAFRRLAMLVDPTHADPAGTVFLVREDRAHPERALALEACREVAHRSPPRRPSRPPAIARHRDLLIALGTPDPDLTVLRELVRLSAGFLDQGQGLSFMPGRERGFLTAVSALYAAGASEPRGAPGVDHDFAAIHAGEVVAQEVIARSLEALGVRGEDVEPYLLGAAAALPGWGGMFQRMEHHPEEGDSRAPCALADFMAVRLVFERRAIEHEAALAGHPSTLAELRALQPEAPDESSAVGATRLFHLAEAAALGAPAIGRLSNHEVQRVWSELEAFPAIARRALWHEAYESWYRRHILDGIAALRTRGRWRPTERRAAQFVFCIDEREESIRRALEEQGPHLETFGAAGFFGVAIDYRGLYDVEPAAHCPVVVVPDHEVHEAPIYTAHGWHALRQRLREGWNRVHRGAHRGSRTLTGGAGLSFLLGPLAATMAVIRVLMPRTSLNWLGRVRDRLFPRPLTRLSPVRAPGEPARSGRGKLVGFSLDEAADRVAGTLRGLGLVEDFAPIIVLLGHGSTSLNNPHESAHDCGACGGRRGGANARLFADLANRQDVRQAVAARGIRIPADTWFVGALHDTADDGVHYYDLELLPAGGFAPFEVADRALQVARELSAQERCRRFFDAPLGISPEAALRHVEARASHLGQPRPEYGHCTNAIAVVGRRHATRGLHLDRRPFLVSYDPSIDPDYAIVERILAAVGPVGAGISLEYYFSSVDNERYGCGTKLPHNVTGFIGVMNGHVSDLRTGLPLQMVEIHEPMRLLLIVEATPAALLHVAGRQAEVRELVVNEWVQLVSLDPDTGDMQVFMGGQFVPYVPGPDPLPAVQRSIDWHGAHRDHLTPALVAAAFGSPAPVAAEVHV